MRLREPREPRETREPQPVLRCNACHTKDGPLTKVEAERVELIVCADPVTCRMRAQSAGIYGLGVAA